jgi:hypothetical protein
MLEEASTETVVAAVVEVEAVAAAVVAATVADEVDKAGTAAEEATSPRLKQAMLIFLVLDPEAESSTACDKS